MCYYCTRKDVIAISIGTIIRNRRLELGLTLEEVGAFVGVGKSTVLKWESGYIENMKRDKIKLLSEVLKISPVSLITGDISTDTNFSQEDELRNAVIKLFDSLSDEGKRQVKQFIEYILSKEGN